MEKSIAARITLSYRDRVYGSIRHTVMLDGQIIGYITELPHVDMYYVCHAGDLYRDNNEYRNLREALKALCKKI